MAAFQPVPYIFGADGSQFIKYLKNWIRLRKQNNQSTSYDELEDGEYNHRPEPLIENENIFNEQTHDAIYDIYENTEEYLKSLSKTLIDSNNPQNPQTIVVNDYQLLHPDIRQSLIKIKRYICFHLYCSFLINTPVFYDMFEYDGLEIIFSNLYENFGILQDFSILQFLFKYHFDNIHNYGFGTNQDNIFFRPEWQLNYVELIYYYIIKSNIVVPEKIDISRYVTCSLQNGIDDANIINRGIIDANGSLIQMQLPYLYNLINSDNTKNELDRLRGLDHDQLVNKQDQEYLRQNKKTEKKHLKKKLLEKQLKPETTGRITKKKENPRNKLRRGNSISIEKKMGFPRKLNNPNPMDLGNFFGGAIKKLRKIRKTKSKRNKTKNRKKKSKSKRKTKR